MKINKAIVMVYHHNSKITLHECTIRQKANKRDKRQKIHNSN